MMATHWDWQRPHARRLAATLLIIACSKIKESDVKLFQYISLFTSLHLALPSTQCVRPHFSKNRKSWRRAWIAETKLSHRTLLRALIIVTPGNSQRNELVSISFVVFQQLSHCLLTGLSAAVESAFGKCGLTQTFTHRSHWRCRVSDFQITHYNSSTLH